MTSTPRTETLQAMAIRHKSQFWGQVLHYHMLMLPRLEIPHPQAEMAATSSMCLPLCATLAL